MSNHGPVGVGLIGAGNISDQYLRSLTSFPDLRVHIVGDLDTGRARAQADKHGVPRSGTAADVLAHDEVGIVVNLTVPAAHADVSSRALAAGKHVWSEKPLAIDRDSARSVLDQAAAAGLRVGVAPDTVLGPAVQTARRALARGDIGRPLSAQTVMQYAGPDAWHPSPEFLFAKGAGPLFDMGPYYITTLLNLFGPAERVAALGSTGRTVRTIRTGDRAGTRFDVTVPTHVSALIQFAAGGISQSVFSFDSPLTRVGVVEITGTEGTMVLPDPNHFSGDVKITRGSLAGDGGDPVWHTVPSADVAAGRGLGVLDMARALRAGRPHIATGDLAYHALDILTSIDESVTTGEYVRLSSGLDDIPYVDESISAFEATL
ncbi:Gfo/Idh/MocA family protein [Streptomyces edwardsiae]|uniref:Gfo/Idh/MocA family oxidoreductase n=1 Tax=Streptomyces edwardsiae TaxID=3075527 RepID=A0ABU2Q9V4_9ACTN|nr:Gfo/Idh/MocA family oxidoreductase [Streptomyces sp. DSM 41635]MDT0401233.1 Gfo/Idh/MocA family oxidoreductase [Streptomyces sp. DSM 41635]